MRIRSVATVLAMSTLLAAAVLRCALPAEPPGPQVFATREKLVRGAILSLPAGASVDRAALVASLKQLAITTVILQASSSQAGSFVDDRVALAIELQRELDADVYIGTYQAGAASGKPMETLLQKDPTFASCYASAGPSLDANAATIDKLRLCSAETSTKIVVALSAANANPRIGCYITHEPELTESLTAEGEAKLNELLRGAAGPCIDANRKVAVSTLLSTSPGDPGRAGLAFRESLRDSGIGLVILQDGVGTFDAGSRRAAAFYTGLRVALADRQAPYGPVAIWGNVEAFDCDSPACLKTHPTTTARLTAQLCAAQARVEGIVTFDYLHHLAERPLVATAAGADASSPELQAILDDTDAAADLRDGYLAWREAGAPCTTK